MIFNRRVPNTPHPSNIALDFKIVLDMTDDSTITLNGSDVSAIANKRSSSYDFGTTAAVNQPSRNGKEIEWEDAGILQHFTAGSEYLFFDEADTDGAFIFALARTNRSSPDSPWVFDFGFVNTDGWGFYCREDLICGYTSTNHGGAVVEADPITSSNAYRNIGLVIEFGSIERLFVNNSQVASQAITILDLRDAYIDQSSTRQLNTGPMTIGLTAKTASQSGRNFYNGAMRALVIGAGIPNEYQRNLIQQYFNALEEVT